MSEFAQPFSRLIWRQNYQFQNESSWSVTADRVGEALAKPEGREKSYFAPIFQDLIHKKRFLPGGRIIANAGTSFNRASLINCFVSGPQLPDVDSMEEINAEVGRCMKILASEGGYGVNANWLRPRGAVIRGTGARTPGAVEMLNIWDQTAETLTKGPEEEAERDDVKEKVRKGAMMVTMSLWHPDVIEFIEAKAEAEKLAHFNMSVLASDQFMQAVRDDKKWALKYPDFEQAPDKYEAEWEGRIRDWDGPEKIYQTVSARRLWNKVMESTYNNNEPGVQFIDTVNRRNPLAYTEFIMGSNPCVAEGTLVNTPDGYEKVENVDVGDEVCTVLGTEPVSEIEVHEDYPVYEVSFSDGATQKVTAAHQYHVKEDGAKSIDERRVGEIEVGDRVRIHGNNEDFNLDLHDWMLGAQRGVVLGDGSISSSTLEGVNRDAFAVCSSIEDEKYNVNIRSLFNAENTTLDKSSEGKACKIWIKGQNLLDSLGITPAKSPEKTIGISGMSRSELLGLFDGLIASDGNVNLKSNHPQLRFDTTSRDLAEVVRNIVIVFGGHATITTSDPGNSEINERKVTGNHKKHTVNISGSSFRKMARKTEMGRLHPEKAEDIKKAQKEFQLSGNYMHAKVTSIERAGNATVYDLYCEESDTWITEGFVQRGCGEQMLPKGGSCDLGNFVLSNYLSRGTSQWSFDWMAFRRDVKYAVRMLDNVNDIAYFPLQEQFEEAQAKRRVGLGHMGFGSTLLMMGIPYGSAESVLVARQIQKTLVNEAYKASAEIAAEKEPFPLFDNVKYISGDMVQRIDPEVRRLIQNHGVRNSHLTSIQPTGNTSQLAGNVSGGLEPVFSFHQQRTAEMPHLPDGLEKPDDMPSHADMYVKDSDGRVEWRAEKQNRELVWRATGRFNDWQVHPTRGVVKDFQIRDYGYMKLQEYDEWDEDASWAVKTMDLSVDDHIRVMKPFAEYIDSAMSKTVNVPQDYDFEDFKDLYMDAWETGLIKGLTTYRAGTMSAVLEDKDEENAQDETICPRCSMELVHKEGCSSCPECGWEKCEI